MQEFCVQIRRSCLAECHKKEDEYQDTIADYAMNMSRAERIRIRRTFAVDFLQDEENSRGGRIIRDCVTERGVSPAWTVFEGNRKFWNDPLLFKYCVEEMAKPTALELLVERVGECPLQWISPEHRVLFYHTCLKKYNINSFRKRSISSMRKLEKIAFVQKAETEKKGSIAIGAGSAQIAGGVLAGIGIVLAPISAGASLTLKVIGSGIALAGSISTLFSPRIIEGNESELKKLKSDAEELSTLLLFFTQSSQELNESHQDQKMHQIAEDLRNKILRQNHKITSTSLLGSLQLSTYTLEVGIPRMVALVNEIQNNYAMIKHFKKTGNRVAEIFRKMATKQKEWKLIRNLDFNEQLKRTPLALRVNRSWRTAGKLPQKAVSFMTMSAMNIGLGVYQVLQGVEQLKASFHHDIISAARGISHETDRIVMAYRDLVGINEEDHFDTSQELFSVSVKIPSWSRGYLIFSNGHNDECTTSSMSFSRGWTKLSTSSELGNCQFYKIYGGNLSVALRSQSSGDSVEITTVQVATDGNHLPSLQWTRYQGMAFIKPYLTDQLVFSMCAKDKRSPQAKRHKLSLLFHFFDYFTSLPISSSSSSFTI